MGWQTNGWRPSSITRFIENRATSTCPVFVESDCGEGVLKGLGAPIGPHALAAELLGSLLAEWLNLPTFDFSTITVAAADELPLPNGSLTAPGPAFISRLVRGTAWGGDAAALASLINPDVITKLIVLDTWIRNCDRFRREPPRINFDNVFLAATGRARKCILLAIDHSSAFTCDREINQRVAHLDQIRDPQIYGVFPGFAPFWNQLVLSDSLARLESMSLEQARRFVALVPPEWDLAPVTRAALESFIVQRAHFLADQPLTYWQDAVARVT